MSNRTRSTEPSETKRKLVDAGINLMRAKGYNATTVDDICGEAGVTKGGFFHYFGSKDELAKAALDHFYQGKVKDYEEAPFRKLADPLDRVFGRLDYVEASSGGDTRPTKGCLFGVFAQEMAFVNPGLRDACQGFFAKIADDVERDLTEASAVHKPVFPFDAKALAMLYVSIVQGSLLLAKVAGNNGVLKSNIEQFRQCLQQIFGVANRAPLRAQSKRTAPALN